MSQDLTADAGEGISWWDKYRDVTMQAISATILVTSLVLAMIPPTSAFGIGLLTTTLTGGLINGLVSGITDSIAAGNNGYNHVTAFADGFARGFTVGVITSAIFYCVMSIANGLAKLANKPAPRSLTNAEARDWYVKNVRDIGNRIDKSMPLEAQARQASALRNEYKIIARDAMMDRQAAAFLDANMKIQTFSESIIKYNGDYQKIIEASMRTNSDFNALFGII